MSVKWHRLSFEHSCGLEGTILQINMTSEGRIAVSGLCVICGEEFTIEDEFLNMVRKAAICDYLTTDNGPEHILEDFVLTGKPS